jgi:RNA polymerase sigma-70 factor (ECF subfamily)
MLHAAFEAIVREERTAIRATLIRLTGNWDLADDCVQEACLRAWETWSRDGLPVKPGAWLTTVARRLALDHLRRERRREEMPADVAHPSDDAEAALLAPERVSGVDAYVLRLIFLCCHPALPRRSQIALTLRNVCGLTTREIARAFVEPESTTAQRLVRARRKLAEERVPFETPPASELPARLDTALSVVYLVFTEGYAATGGPALLRQDLSQEAIRLARLLVRLVPGHAEAEGLLALMLLHDARRMGRVDSDGDLILLEEQDRSLWDRARITEGVSLLGTAMQRLATGPYQLQAAIAALHAEAPTAAETDWRQIAELYRALLRLTPSPVLELNAAVALAMSGRVEEALAWIESIDSQGELTSYHLLPAARADLLRRQGRNDEAREAYTRAVSLASNDAEQRYLQRRLSELSDKR